MSEPAHQYGDKNLVQALIKKITQVRDSIDDNIRIMHVCGTHEHDIVKAGLRSLLPKEIELIAGVLIHLNRNLL